MTSLLIGRQLTDANTQKLQYVVQYVALLCCIYSEDPRVSTTAERPAGTRLLLLSPSPVKPVEEDKIG